jgi:hypothetical protein
VAIGISRFSVLIVAGVADGYTAVASLATTTSRMEARSNWACDSAGSRPIDRAGTHRGASRVWMSLRRDTAQRGRLWKLFCCASNMTQSGA